MPVSVIIPSYNRREELCRCIDSVLTQDYAPIEIIVVDDANTDDTVEYLKYHYPNILLISCTHRYGPSHLRNLGINAATGEYLLFLDSDVIMPDRGMIGRMVEILSHDHKIGEIGGEIPVSLGIYDQARGKRRDFFGKNHDVIVRKPGPKNDKSKSCTYLATCNCMVRRDVALRVGGFDPYYGFGGEDTDFGYRIQSLGYRNCVSYKTGAHHNRSVGGRHKDETYRYHSTRVRFNLKHFSLRRNLIIFLMDFIQFIFFYLAFIPKILIKKAKGQRLVIENFLGGLYLLRAYLDNLLRYRETVRCRRVNFLGREEMDRFESLVALESK